MTKTEFAYGTEPVAPSKSNRSVSKGYRRPNPPLKKNLKQSVKTPKARSILKNSYLNTSTDFSTEESFQKAEKKVQFTEPLPEVKVKSPKKVRPAEKQEPVYTRTLQLILEKVARQE
eukprot:CAMPEP_0114589814 /NCGR_PEP_ID=MMETSP0125-20121206/12184_1 /TAXON_ID=485358 ORGANISM="Aristerostoma sp., Strain ATCC 50986" /NCGR_SAMPLE_ID=MMETSP0125 /ASSEMBLY_ACC=CAM_ASM_000245 /LENGTH=116 /DNA_ID=CAMNT_0001786921 /DNA_START=57 /DNA_END=407 /DNA_ORIENTATION=-